MRISLRRKASYRRLPLPQRTDTTVATCFGSVFGITMTAPTGAWARAVFCQQHVSRVSQRCRPDVSRPDCRRMCQMCSSTC